MCTGCAAPRPGRCERLAKSTRSAARGRAMAAAARREAVAAVVRATGLTGEAVATSGAAARGGQRRGAPASRRATARGARAIRGTPPRDGGRRWRRRGARRRRRRRRRERRHRVCLGERSGGGRRSSGGARSLLTGALLSLGAHATATGVPGNGDRARAAFTTRARSSRSRVPRGKRSFRPTSSGAQGSRRSAGGVALHGPAGCSGEGRRARTSTESLRAAGGARARARRLSAG